jgi:hypothetical protein
MNSCENDITRCNHKMRKSEFNSRRMKPWQDGAMACCDKSGTQFAFEMRQEPTFAK